MTAPVRKTADQYDGGYDYTAYWSGRDYEHRAEQVAVQRLVSDRRYRHAVDIGGGFGRLSLLLTRYADRVTLAEPSVTQLAAAKRLLEGTCVEQVQMQADDLGFADGSLDLVLLVRVMHHLPDPTAEFAEIARVLERGGVAVIEVANYGHAVNRLKYLRRRRQLPSEPVSISSSRQDADQIAFVNHSVNTVVRQLNDSGLVLDGKLSVSNLRSARLKRLIPIHVLLAVEKTMQRPLARFNFGPSIFLKLHRA